MRIVPLGPHFLPRKPLEPQGSPSVLKNHCLYRYYFCLTGEKRSTENDTCASRRRLNRPDRTTSYRDTHTHTHTPRLCLPMTLSIALSQPTISSPTLDGKTRGRKRGGGGGGEGTRAIDKLRVPLQSFSPQGSVACT